VSLTELKELGFPSNFSKAQLVGLLHERYPEQQWDEVLFFRGRLAGQKKLERAVVALFPVRHEYLIAIMLTFKNMKGVEVKSNVRKDAALLNEGTGSYLELDIWIPSLQLALEYQV